MRITRQQLGTYTVILIFMVVTAGHVANFAGSFEPDGWQWLGWPYALAVDASIAACSWLTRWKTTRTIAWIGYFAFVAASGILNVTAISPWIQESQVGAWVYSLFPTVAISLLGFLARDTELLAERSANSKKRKTQPQVEEPQPVTVEGTPQIPPMLPPEPLTPRQIAQIKAVLAIHGANESATLLDLQESAVIGSATTASRARKLAVLHGYLEETANGYAPNGRAL